MATTITADTGCIPSLLRREAVVAATVASLLAALLAWLGPPGTDLAAHVYQRALFLEHGFSIWNNFWYAGRYSFVTYSLLYYPLAALLGIRLLGVVTIALAAVAFALVVEREWGRPARWSSRAFAVVWPGMMLSGAFPFALGAALGLLALRAIQGRRRLFFPLLAALALAASPLAFLLIVLVLVGVALERRDEVRTFVAPGAALAVAALVEVVLWRVFPSPGRYPFSLAELAAACAFCVLGALLSWRVQSAGLLRFVFVVYLVASLTAFAVPSGVGENIARIRFAAIPVAILTLSLRAWRPRVVAAVALALAVAWNLTPLAASFVHASDDPASRQAYWRPAIAFLRANLTASYRVEAVDTRGHWPAVYLAGAGIPLARGWFRQDDFPQNQVLYTLRGEEAYLSWLRGLGVRYVVLAAAAPDYSARGEARLLRSGRSGLRLVLESPHLRVYEVHAPRPLVTGPAPARVLALRQARVDLRLERPGRYRVAVRYSPYWHPSMGCVSEGEDGMVRVSVRRPGVVRLRFAVNAKRALQTLAGEDRGRCLR